MIVCLCLGFSVNLKENKILKPPIAKKIPKAMTIHGHTRIDNYYWLRERDNPKVIEYLEAENEYTEAFMKHTEPLQEVLYKEMAGRSKRGRIPLPVLRNGYYYYNRGGIRCRKKGSLEAEEEILLDINEMKKGYDYYRVGRLFVSPNNKFMAFGVDTVGRRMYTVFFKDLATGEMLPDTIEMTTGSVAWANDSKTVFYSAIDEKTFRPYKILKHILGTDVSTDKSIYEENDESFSVSVNKSKSHEFLFILTGNQETYEYHFLDADNPGSEFQIIQPREKGLKYTVEHYDDKFYILTNWKAKNFRLMETPLTKTTQENWKEVIPHSKDASIVQIEVFKDFLVVAEAKFGLPQLRIISMKDKTEHYLDFGEETYSAYLAPRNREFNTDLLFYQYSSFTTPGSLYEYNMKTREKRILTQDQILGGFDRSNYHSERINAIADDGVEIPISLVYRKGLKKDGHNPLLLMGYGHHGVSEIPSFNPSRLSLLDRGFIYAIAHVRGGGELGPRWHEEGKLLKKRNTYTDFIACAEFLIAEKFTNSKKLFAIGNSSGGTLVSVVLNMRPQLFRGVIAIVPWVDVLTSLLDKSIPWTSWSYDEWGDPHNKEYYDYVLSFSPYDNIEKKDYSALLVTAGYHDSQVQYWGPAKWIAKLRAMKTNNNPLLLKTNMKAGHSGPSDQLQRMRETAFMYAFLLDLANK
ncbi:MAG: S9 family peptidase [Candidatus Aminicenantes bacterium]|nr:MAG: S9 family peptidase [Candidatus Aminicenantes bacterium]